VITSYQLRSSGLSLELPRLCIVISSKTFLVSVIGIFEYILVMSREANVEAGVIGVCCNWQMRSVEFIMLNAFGSGMRWLIFWVNSFESL
jgi:hypothetical protein